MKPKEKPLLPDAAVLAAAPDWVKSGQIVHSLDARPLLERGHHPKTEVLAQLATLQPGQIFQLTTPFVPGPLIDIGRAQDLAIWTVQSAPDHFDTYFGMPA
jgi:hypothetical protein